MKIVKFHGTFWTFTHGTCVKMLSDNTSRLLLNNLLPCFFILRLRHLRKRWTWICPWQPGFVLITHENCQRPLDLLGSTNSGKSVFSLSFPARWKFTHPMIWGLYVFLLPLKYFSQGSHSLTMFCYCLHFPIFFTHYWNWIFGYFINFCFTRNI